MMKKKSMALLAGVLSLALLAGCGEKEDPNTLAGVDTSQYVTLGQYTDLVVTVDGPATITDDQVIRYIENNYLGAVKEQVDVTDRAAQIGDTVAIECVGKMDGEVFEGGSTEDGQTWTVTLGSGSMIPGFEEGIVGMNLDETKDVEVTFPENYGATNLAGKPAVFTITVRSITMAVIPELSDEVVEKLNLGYTNVDQLKDAARTELEEEALETYEDNAKNAILSTVLAGCEFQDPPAFLVETNQQTLKDSIQYYATMLGMDLETILSAYYGMTMEEFETSSYEAAVAAAKESVAIEAIADAEKLSKISDKELDKEAEDYIAESATYSSVEALYEDVTRENFRNYIVSQRVIDFLNEHNTLSNN